MVAGLSERARLREAFGAFVNPAVTERVLAEGTDLRGEEIEISILFLDVRGFTAFAERAAAQQVVDCLNELYEAIVPAIERHGGHANKFVGDGLLAVFGAPERHRDHAARALAAAYDIVQLVRDGAAGDLRVGLGVNSGRVVVGTIGGGGRRDFTVIGDPVNTAVRVEAATRLTGDDILITESTMRALGAPSNEFEERPAVPLKGTGTAPARAVGSSRCGGTLATRATVRLRYADVMPTLIFVHGACIRDAAWWWSKNDQAARRSRSRHRRRAAPGLRRSGRDPPRSLRRCRCVSPGDRRGRRAGGALRSLLRRGDHHRSRGR
jgi:class 3 adenylate cyclase